MQTTSARVTIGSRLLLRDMRNERLEQVKLVPHTPDDRSVYTVGLRRSNARPLDEQERVLQVSDASPLGRALLGKKRGEIVTVEAPAGVFTWEIVEVFD